MICRPMDNRLVNLWVNWLSLGISFGFLNEGNLHVYPMHDDSETGDFAKLELSGSIGEKETSLWKRKGGEGYER